MNNNLKSNLKWLWGHLANSKWLLFLSTVILFFESFFNLNAIRLQQVMIDNVLIGGNDSQFWPTLMTIVLSYLLFSLCFLFGPHVMHFTMARTRVSMNKELMEHMHKTPIRSIHKERTANYVYYFSKDTEVNCHIASSDLPRFVQKLVTITMILYITATANILLFIVMIVMVTLYIILGKKYAPLQKKAVSSVNKNQADLLISLEEGISATREVIAFHRHDWEKRNYLKKFDMFFSSVMWEGKLFNKQLLLSEPLRWGVMLLVLLYSGFLVLNNQMSIGVMVIIFQYSSRFVDATSGLYDFVIELSGKMASVERTRNVLINDRIEDGSLTLSGDIQSIRLENVSFKYEDHDVLKKCNATFKKGQKTAIVGSSGGGKSTIANLLIRFIDSTQGNILINGINLNEIKRSEWVKKITLLSQEPYLFPASIKENLLLGMTHISDEKIIEVCSELQIHNYISSLPDGYNTVIGERGISLSGGQRQLIALSRAVLRNTDILVLDEATSALDLETERRVQRYLDQIRRDKITIVIAHRLSTIQNADLILVLNTGEIAEEGNHDWLLNNALLYPALTR